MKYMLIAGEASGDLHASCLIEELRRSDPSATFVVVGGDLMARAAGVEPVVHYRDMAYMGFVDVAAHLPAVVRNLRTVKQTLRRERPDVLIPVDYPSFNLKIASLAHRLGIRVDYYISPKLWAWKAWRIRTIRRVVDRVLCILPFEPQWYADRGYPRAVYVGNPTVEELRESLAHEMPRSEFLRIHRLRDRRIIALLPGSRRSEIRSNLPVMDAVARRFPQYTIVVAAAPGIDDDFYRPFTSFQIVRDATHSLLAHSHAALITSGTATLEAAVARVPQVALYRSNGSSLTYKIMERVLKIPFVTLPNLIAGRAVIPEMLLHNCTPDAVAQCLQALTPDNAPARAEMLEGYDEIAQLLGHRPAAATAARTIVEANSNHH